MSDIPGREDGLKNLLQWISEDREWCFDLKLAEWDGEFPSFFRVWRPYIIGNYRHDYMDCEKLDKDPQKDNLKIIAVWGHGLGVTFEGKLGVVTNFSECGGYFLPERDEHGNRIPVQREHIGHHPESGKPPFFNNDLNSDFSYKPIPSSQRKITTAAIFSYQQRVLRRS